MYGYNFCENGHDEMSKLDRNKTQGISTLGMTLYVNQHSEVSTRKYYQINNKYV